MKNRSVKAVATALALISMLTPLAGAEKPVTATQDAIAPKLPSRILSFMAAKERQARALARRNNLEWTPDVSEFFAAATNGDCALTRDLAGVIRSVKGGVRSSPVRQIVVEVTLATDIFCEGDPKYPLAMGDAIVRSIPRGSIYLGGNDWGRGLPTALCASHETGDPFFPLTQNAPADRSEMVPVGRGFRTPRSPACGRRGPRRGCCPRR